MAEAKYFDKLKSKTSTKPITQVNSKNIYHCQSGILTEFEANEHALYIILHLTNQHDGEVRKACRTLPQLRESLHQSHPTSRLEVTLGIGYSKTRDWLNRVNIPFPKSFKAFEEIRGPTGKTMPYTSKLNLYNLLVQINNLKFRG